MMQNRKPLSVEEMYEDMSQVFFMQYVLHASCRVRIWAPDLGQDDAAFP